MRNVVMLLALGCTSPASAPDASTDRGPPPTYERATCNSVERPTCPAGYVPVCPGSSAWAVYYCAVDRCAVARQEPTCAFEGANPDCDGVDYGPAVCWPALAPTDCCPWP